MQDAKRSALSGPTDLALHLWLILKAYIELHVTAWLVNVVVARATSAVHDVAYVTRT